MGDLSWAPLRDPLLAQPPRDPSSSPHDPQRGREGGREGEREGRRDGGRQSGVQDSRKGCGGEARFWVSTGKFLPEP